MVDELLTHYQHVIDEFRLVTSDGGAFEFSVNGELLFSKKTIQRRHAQPGEILQMFREIVGPDVPVYPQGD